MLARPHLLDHRCGQALLQAAHAYLRCIPMHNLCLPALHVPLLPSLSWEFFQKMTAVFHPRNYQQRFSGLALARHGARLCAGHPSSALPDTDGRHDRSGHGTWVLLAVFVAHDCRPWLSVAGTAMQVSACTEEWIRELVTGGRRSARYAAVESLLSARDWR